MFMEEKRQMANTWMTLSTFDSGNSRPAVSEAVGLLQGIMGKVRWEKVLVNVSKRYLAFYS